MKYPDAAMNEHPEKPSNPLPDKAVEARKARDLAWRAQAGDENAFGELVVMYNARVYAVIFNMVGNAEDARDLAQQTWVKAWSRLASFQAAAGFFTWLYRIAANTALDFLRSRSRRREDSLSAHREGEPDGPDVDLPAGEQWRPDSRMEAGEIQAAFQAALDKLTPEHRLALTLREVEGLSYREIAEVMKCRSGTVMSRIFYARKMIQEEMKGLL